MVGSVNAERASRPLEFGMYRDGDNNLDEVQSVTIAQALQTSSTDSRIEFTVEDTTSRRGLEPAHVLRTESYTIADGDVTGNIKISKPHDMSARKDLATFVDHVLDNAEASGAKQTWIDLIDHGGGDGGGMQSEHSKSGIMREDDIAGAIADGVAQHAKEHPEDAGRHVDGVVANQWQNGVVCTGFDIRMRLNQRRNEVCRKDTRDYKSASRHSNSECISAHRRGRTWCVAPW